MKEKSLYGIINDDDTLTGVIHQEKYYVKITPIIPLIDKFKVYIKSSILGKTILESLARGWGKIVALIDASAELNSKVRGKGRVQASVEGSTSVNVTLGEQASLYDSDVQSWLDLITDKPSATQIGYIDTMIKDMKSGLNVNNMSDWSDVFYHLAAETAEASLKNIVKDAHHAVAVNSPVFTPLEGWQGDGISSYIDSNYSFNRDGDNYTTNNCSLGIYVRSDIAENASDIGQQYLSNRQVFIQSKRADDLQRYRHQLNSRYRYVRRAGGPGMHIACRDGNDYGHLYGYRNSVAGDPDGGTTGLTENPTNYNMYILCQNNDNTPILFSTKQLSLAFAGKFLSEGNVGVITDEFEALMDKNGKGVIE